MKSTIKRDAVCGKWTIRTGDLKTVFSGVRSAAEQIATLQQEIERLRAIVEAAKLNVSKIE